MYTKRTKLIGALLAIIMLMQVFCTSITSVVLATETENPGVEGSENESTNEGTEGSEEKEEENSTEKTITFVDENLYVAIKESQKDKLMSYSDKDRTMTISNENIAKITSLYLAKKEIKDLTGLEYFTGLTTLDLTSNKIKNIDALKGLTNLQELTLANNNIEDCTPLEGLTNLNKGKLTVGSQDLEKTIIINAEDIENNSFKYSLPQIFSYIKKVKQELGENIDLGSPVIEGKDTYLKEKINRATVNEEVFEVQVNNITDGYYGYVYISYEYRTATGLGTKLALRLLVVNDAEKRGIVFEDAKLYEAVKANIEGTQINGYADSKYPVIRDDNDGCVWYDDILSLVINRHYLYKEIKELDLVNKQIQNLEGLQYFVGLSDLDLSNNFISDISKLEEFGKEKETAEADLKQKVKEKYDELVKSIDKKEEALSLLTLQGKKAAINKVISEMRSYISGLAEEELDSETKSELTTYFLNEIEADSLVSEGNNTNVTNLINGKDAIIGTNKIDNNNQNCIITISGNTIEYEIPRSGENAEGNIDITSSIKNYIIDQFKKIQKINNGYCEVEGEFINVANVLANVVKDIEDDIEDLEKYVDIEDLLLILPKETIELTETEIESLTLEETKTLAQETINAFKSALSTLTAEELKVAFDNLINNLDDLGYIVDNASTVINKYTSNMECYNVVIDAITNYMNNILSTITDKDDDDYIGDDKDELEEIIFEYIEYQLKIIESRDNEFLSGIYIPTIKDSDTGEEKYLPVEILTDEALEHDYIMDYDIDDLDNLPVLWLRPMVLDVINAFIEAYGNDNNSKIPKNIENWIEDFPTKSEMEEEYDKVEEGTAKTYITSSDIAKILIKYINYNNILLKEINNYTTEELKSIADVVSFNRLKELTLQIIDKYIDSYDEFSIDEKNSSNMPTKSSMQTEYERVSSGHKYYDTNSELINTIVEYRKYQNGINEVYIENFESESVSYSDYIKEALLEADTDEDKNYMSSDIDTEKYKLDQSDVKNIISRFKDTKFDEIIALPKTKVLNLSSNNLTDISILTNIPTLVEIYVSDNIIRDLSLIDFTKFEKLNTLDLSHNRITETKIGLIPTLQNLNLAYNYIENLEGMDLGSFVRLQSIDLSGNRIYDVQNIMYNLHLIANYQLDNEIVPIINYSHGNAHIFSHTKVEECGYIVDKSKVKFEDQKIYASVAEKIMQGAEEYVKLPAIFNQVKYIDCGETNFLNAKATNDGMITYLETGRLGEQTEAAYIQGTGIATGTVCYITYTVATEEEVKTIPVTNIYVQEEVVLEDENSRRPDLNGDEKVTTEDLNILKNGIAGIITLTDEQKTVSDIVPDKVLDMNDVLVLEQIIKTSWQNNKLTLEQRELASNAKVDSDEVVDEEDLRLLALHIIGNKEVTGNFNQDIDGDGKTDISDIILLSKYVASKSTERRNTDSITLAILNEYKEIRQLHANILPEDATDKNVTWVSNNENVVKVDSNGKVTAVGEGTTTINVASNSNANIFKTIRVDVVKAVNIVEDINIVLNEETGNPNIKTEYYIGEELDLSGAKLEVIRRDGSKEILDITPEMLEGFTTETEGEKIVTVAYEDVTTTFEVNVTKYNEPKVDITVDNLDVKLPENVVYDGQEHLAEVALKEGVKAGELTVSYKDEAENIVEKPVNAGTYKVIASLTDSIYANPAEIEVGTFTITKAELPEDQRPSIATEYTVEKDGNLNVTVENGIITMPEGTVFDEVGTKDVTLTFVPNDTNYANIEIPVKVNVVISVTGVNLDKQEITIVKGGTVSLVATVMPENATNKNVIWSSSDETIAKVEDGKVTAVAVGEVTITVTTKDGEKSTTCKVIVKEQVYGARELKDGTIAITGINPDTTEEYFRSKFLSGNTYKIFKADGVTELSDTDTIGTGYKLKVYDENGTIVEEQLLVVKGDTNGDGKASATDSGNILAHRTGEKALENEYLLAADINNDGTIDGRDSTLLIYHRIGMVGYILQNN